MSRLIPAHIRKAIEAAADAVDCLPSDITGPRRFPDIIRGRYALILALRTNKFSYSAIARLLNRDHTTVMYAARQAKGLLYRDAAFFDLVTDLSIIVRNKPSFPYPGHRTMAEVMADEARMAA